MIEIISKVIKRIIITIITILYTQEVRGNIDMLSTHMEDT